MVTKAKKEESIADLKDKLGRAKVAIVTDYRGLTVKEISSLRRRLREHNAEYTVAKNTLLRRALQDHPAYKGLDEFLKGPTAITFGYEDMAAPAKTLQDFVKETKKPYPTVRGGVVEGRTINANQVKELAAMPSREELLARLLGAMQGPVRGLATVMNQLPTGMVRVLNAVREQKEAGGGSAAAPTASAAPAAAPAEAPAPAAEAAAPAAEAPAPAAEAPAAPTE